MFGQLSYRDGRILPFSASHLFAVVLDVERYHEFIPWCESIRIISQNEEEIKAEVKVSFRGMRVSYISFIKFSAPTSEKNGFIEVKSTEGAFKNLYNLWEFYPQEKGSKVTFYIEYTFRSRLVNSVVRVMHNTAQKRIIEAFENRCKTLPDLGLKT